MKELDRRFATALKNLCDAPPVLAEALRQFNEISEAPDVLIFSPAFSTMDICRPASLLALTRTHWAIAINSRVPAGQPADQEGSADLISAFASPFTQTPATELSILLLDGRLAIHGGGNSSTALIIYFNTVMEKIYRGAMFFALDQMTAKADGIREEIPDSPRSPKPGLSMKFNSALERFTPPGRTVHSYAAWPAVFGGFHRQLSLAAMLVRTQRELILISDESPTDGLFQDPQQNLGYVVTYMPLEHIRAVALKGSGKLNTLEITLTAGQTTESIAIVLPDESGSAAGEVAQP